MHDFVSRRLAETADVAGDVTDPLGVVSRSKLVEDLAFRARCGREPGEFALDDQLRERAAGGGRISSN